MNRSYAQRALDELFLRMLLRGSSGRMRSQKVGSTITQSKRLKRSVQASLSISAVAYGLMGLFSLFFWGQPVFLLSTVLHGFSFFTTGLLIAWSAGELLFNKAEADILLHRPVTPAMLLKAKAGALLKYSLVLALALNFVGLFVGGMSSATPVLYVLAHLVSTVEAGLFNVCFVVVSYQLCLKLVGREKLEGAMTTMQVLVVASITVGSQMTRFLFRSFQTGPLDLEQIKWVKFLPPTWFGAFDDAVAGTHSLNSWKLAGLGLAVTALLMWLAFSRLAGAYGHGIQVLNEGPTTKPGQLTQARFLVRVSEKAPLKWLLKDPVSRAAFLLVTAYIWRDRDVKLRLFPGIAQSAFYPFFFVFVGFTSGKAASSSFQFDSFVIPFGSMYLCMVPLMGLTILASSAHYQASSIFRIAPLSGPASLCHGGRVAFVFAVCLPLFLLFVGVTTVVRGVHSLPLTLVGLIALPVFVLLPTMSSNPCPLSNPPSGKRASVGCWIMMASVITDFAIAGAAGLSEMAGMLPLFLVAEAASVALMLYLLNRHIKTATWGPLE